MYSEDISSIMAKLIMAKLSIRTCKLFLTFDQRFTYRVLQTIKMKLIFLYVWAEQAILGSAEI